MAEIIENHDGRRQPGHDRDWRNEAIPDLPDVEMIEKRRRRRARLIALSAGAVLIGGGAWYALTHGGVQVTGETPLIRAPEGPDKERPENPGGLEVPNQDKLVYNRVGDNGPRPGVERLLPPPEAPLPPPAAMPPPQRRADAPTAPAAPPSDPAREAPQSVESLIAKTAPEVVAPPPKPPAAEAPVPSAPVSAADKAFRVQVAALRDEAKAREAWRGLQTKHPDLLGGLNLSVERADLKDKGIYYRVRGGPLPDRAAAVALCEQLKARKVGCLVVKP